MVVFFGDKTNSEVLASLEGIDDDLDGHEIPFVMSDNAELAGEFDIESFPALVAFQVSMANNRFVQDSAWSSSFVVAHHEHTFFQKGIPQIFEGEASDSQAVLEWILELNGLWDKTLEGSGRVEDTQEESMDIEYPHYYMVRKMEGEADQTFVVGRAPSVVLVSPGGVSVYKSDKVIKPFA